MYTMPDSKYPIKQLITEEETLQNLLKATKNLGKTKLSKSEVQNLSEKNFFAGLVITDACVKAKTHEKSTKIVEKGEVRSGHSKPVYKP